MNNTNEGQSSILLKNGTVLQHDDDDNVQILRDTDVLITGRYIQQIGQNLTSSPDTFVIDCTGKIVSPGFVDAHHHVWQTQLKGRHGDHTLLDYIPAGNLQSYNYHPSDVFWGQLAGNLELIDGATTTVVDHAHVITSPEHGEAALNGTVASGIRSVFCYGPMSFRIAKWTLDTFELDRGDPLPEWFWTQLEQLSARSPFGPDQLVQLGFFFDSYYLPPDVISTVFSRVRELGVKLITSHFRHFPLRTGQEKIPEMLDANGLLAPDLLLSHGNGTTPSQAEMLRKAGVYLASTPDAEIFMASGQSPIAFREDLQPLTCLGADCHTVGSGSMLHQMQVSLAHARTMQANATFDRSKYPRQIRATVQHAYNLATIRGARAIGMGDKIGSLKEGKLADIVILDGSTPTMSCAVETDPVAAVVRHASAREVDTVIIGGKIRKNQGKLLSVELPPDHADEAIPKIVQKTPRRLTWSDIAKELAFSKSAIDLRGKQQSVEVAKSTFLKMMGVGDDVLE